MKIMWFHILIEPIITIVVLLIYLYLFQPNNVRWSNRRLFPVSFNIAFSFIFLLINYNLLIRCTFWFNAGSRIIDNTLIVCFFLFLAPAGGSNQAASYPYTFSNPVGAKLYFNKHQFYYF